MVLAYVPRADEIPTLEGGFLFHFDGGLAAGIITASRAFFLQAAHVSKTACVGVPVRIGNSATFAAVGTVIYSNQTAHN